MLKKTFLVLSIIIAVASLYPYLHLAISVFNYPYNIYLDEGSYIRKAVVFLNEGLAFNNLNEYPYFMTIYGFLYELVISPLLIFIEPTVNAGRLVTLISTVIIIIITFFIIYKKTNNLYLSFIFSGTIIIFKLIAIFTLYSKNDIFLALLTLVVLFSLYFNSGKKQFIVTLVFTCFALMTKQTSIFVVPVVITVWFLEKKTYADFFKKSALWLTCIAVIFLILFLAIRNYFYNTIVISGMIGHITWSLKHMIISQTLPLLRSCAIYFILVFFLVFLNKKAGKKILTPSFLFILYYSPLFLWTSMSTGSMPVYYVFIVIGLSILIPELIISYFDHKIPAIIYLAICFQLIIFQLFTSQKHFLKFYYPEPGDKDIQEAREIEQIVSFNGIENSLVTFSWSSYGISKQSAKFHFDFNHGYLVQMGVLNLTPYINDFNKKRFSVIVGGFDYPETKEAILKNYYLFKTIGETPVYLPRKD